MPKKLFIGKKAVFIAPVINNIPPQKIPEWKELAGNSLFVLLPQGFFRAIVAGGNIEQVKWEQSDWLSGLADIIILSEKDSKDIDMQARLWSRKGTVTVVTKESKGCTVYNRGEGMDFQAFKINRIIDSTGAGDIFAGAFVFMYLTSRNLETSAVFANAAAGLSLRFHSDSLKYDYTDIIKFIRVSGRSIKL